MSTLVDFGKIISGLYPLLKMYLYNNFKGFSNKKVIVVCIFIKSISNLSSIKNRFRFQLMVCDFYGHDKI